jgi:hypothetical protein
MWKKLAVLAFWAMSAFGGRALAEEVKTPVNEPNVKIVQTENSELEEKIQLIESKEEAPMSLRDAVLDSGNPLTDFDSNANWVYSVSQLIGKGTDVLGVQLGLDDHLAARLGMGLVSWYLAAGVRYYSHEIAHDVVYRKCGLDAPFKIDFTDFEYAYPRYIQKEHVIFGTAPFSYDEAIMAKASGFNQDAINSEKFWEKSALSEKINFHDDKFFFMTKMSNLVYRLSAGFQDTRVTPAGQDLQFVFDYFHTNSIQSDPDTYTMMLANKGIDLTKMHLFFQNFLADALTCFFWESGMSIMKYLIEGKKGCKALNLKLGENSGISPPLINCFLTENGTFYDSSVIAKIKNHKFKFNFGVAAEVLFGEGEVDNLRVGAKYFGSELLKAGSFYLSANPYIHLNTSLPFTGKSFGYKGASAGTEFEIGVKLNDLKNRFSVFIQLEYNDNDILENKVKMEDHGFNAKVGTKIEF